MTHWEEVWRFETRRFAIIAETAPEEMDPADQFSDPRDVEAIERGDVCWFEARVRVVSRETDLTLGSDYLGACAYSAEADLFRGHATGRARLRRLRGKTDRASRRERKALREMLANNASLGPRVSYCDYGPEMVRAAVSQARDTIARLRL